LGYQFAADALVFPLAPALVPRDEEGAHAYCRTLGKALVAGAEELLEIEQDEIAYFQHPDGNGGWLLTFYETAPGGAGYLENLAKSLPEWARAAQDRLYNHECGRACYRCLKSARNQFDHALLDKELVRSALFQFGEVRPLGEPHAGRAGDGRIASSTWVGGAIESRASVPTKDTPIEKSLLAAIRAADRLPEPTPQHELRADNGSLITVPDFAYPDQRIAIYCDGFAYHGDRDALESDARKRNTLQAMGWAVLGFWGRQVLRAPERCEEQIWRCYRHRVADERTGPDAQ